LVVIETKATKHSDRITQSDASLGDTDAGKQMSESWIKDKFRDMYNSDDTAETEFVEDLEDAGYIDIRKDPTGEDKVILSNVRTELAVYQDGDITGKFASRTLKKRSSNKPTIDSVEAIKIGDVFVTE